MRGVWFRLPAAGVTPDAGLVLIIAPCAISGIAVGARVLQIASREFLQAAMTALLLAGRYYHRKARYRVRRTS